MANKNNHSDETELVNMKLPFILRDYQSYFEAASRLLESITQLRSWEAALVSGLCVVILTRQNPITLYIGAPLLFVIFVFSFLEASIRADLIATTNGVIELEKDLQLTNIKSFKKAVINWTYGNTFSVLKRPRRSQRYKNIAREFFRPTILLWHGGLALVVIVLVFLIS